MTLRIRFLVSTAACLAWAGGALAQEVPAAPVAADEPAPDSGDEEIDENGDEDGDEIVVVGQRLPGSVIGDIPPEDTLNARDVRATGATDVTELLEALAPQLGSARGRGGERPVVLLNGQRVSGFREIRDIPTEAIQRVEILPEEVALKYGYRADQRVVNIVLRRRFRSTIARLGGNAASEGGYGGAEADLTRLIIQRDGRTTLDLDVETSGSLTEAERDIALAEDSTLDQRDARTLVGSRRQVTATATHNRPILGVSATLNGEYEHSEGRSLLGYPADGLLDPRARDTRSDSGHAGVALNWDKSSWRYSVTGNADLVRSVTGTDPDEIEFGVGRDRARTVRASGDLDATANGPLFRLPAGDASVTLKAGASTLHLDSRRRNDGETTPTSLGRSLASFGGNLDLPISRRNRDLDVLGNLTLNLNAELGQLSDFGTLVTFGGGFNWSPVNPVNLIASWTREEGAPSIQQLGDPLLETSDFRIFDFTRGETVLVNALTGGNPDLEADRRTVFKIGGNWRPLGETDLRLRAEYVRSRLDNPISGFPGPSPALEEAFPERFVRGADDELLSVDLRPVNFDQARRDTIRWGIDFTKPLNSRRPSPEQIQQLRARFAPAGGGQPGAAPPGDGPPREARTGGGGRGFGGGGGGRFGGRQGGRLDEDATEVEQESGRAAQHAAILRRRRSARSRLCHPRDRPRGSAGPATPPAGRPPPRPAPATPRRRPRRRGRSRP